MIKARNRKLSMILVLAMLMTMFAGLGTASAASDYKEVIVQSVSSSGATLDKAKFAINVSDVAALSDGSLLTIHLPAGIKMDNAATDATNQKVSFDGKYFDVVSGNIYDTTGIADINVSAPRYLPNGDDNALYNRTIAYAVGKNSLEVQVPLAPATGVGLVYVEFKNALVDDTFDGDIYANILTPDGSGFDPGRVRFAKFISGGGGTQTIANSVVSMGEDTKTLESIMIQETAKNSIENGEQIKLKLPAGFKWMSAGRVVGAWSFTGRTFTPSYLESGRTLVITAPASGLEVLTSEGRIYIDGAQITVSDTDVAKMGDVTVDVYSDLGNVTDQEVVVASYKDYDVVVEAEKEVEVIAGLDDVTLGNIKITENLAGSILGNRTIKLTLPSGVKWHVDSTDSNDWPENAGINPFTFESVKGSISLSDLGGMPTVTSNNGRTIKLSVGAGPFSKSSFLLKKLKVTISPDFAGDLNVEVDGTAGVVGTVKVATVKAPVELVADGKAELIIGAQAQAAGDIIIREAAKEAIDASADTPHLIVRLPEDAKWFSKPTVKVTEGDLVIDKIDTDGRDLTINFKASSTEPSEITISDVKITLNRNLPEGDFKVSVSSASQAIVENADDDKFDVSTIVSAVLGQCVTPAPGEIVGNCEFRIGSNIYYAGGVAKVMDVAPYIKGDRTYVPMRYMGEALGAEVVWDDAARTVTLTKGETTVVFTIGSTTYTVNGESKTADVAPEIANDRTMLPARFVAEAFGAVVGWDAATQTVLITK